MSEAQDHDTHYHELTGEEAHEKITELVKGIHIAMLTTVDKDGTMNARPMAVQNEPFHGTLWFLTRLGSEKVYDIDERPNVTLTFAEPKSSKYLALKGKGSISVSRDKIKDLWNPLYKAWFPKGPEDPDIAVLRVDVSDGDYWEASGSRLIMLAKYAFTAATGGKVELGEAGHVTV